MKNALRGILWGSQDTKKIDPPRSNDLSTYAPHTYTTWHAQLIAIARCSSVLHYTMYSVSLRLLHLCNQNNSIPATYTREGMI